MTEEFVPTPVVEPEPVVEVKTRKSLSIPAIISFVAGIGTYAWFFAMIGSKWLLTLILAPIIALAAIITGHMAQNEIRKSQGTIIGRFFANTGLILGYFYFAVVIFIVVLTIVLGVGLGAFVANMFGL